MNVVINRLKKSKFNYYALTPPIESEFSAVMRIQLSIVRMKNNSSIIATRDELSSHQSNGRRYKIYILLWIRRTRQIANGSSDWLVQVPKKEWAIDAITYSYIPRGRYAHTRMVWRMSKKKWKIASTTAAGSASANGVYPSSAWNERMHTRSSRWTTWCSRTQESESKKTKWAAVRSRGAGQVSLERGARARAARHYLYSCDSMPPCP